MQNVHNIDLGSWDHWVSVIRAAFPPPQSHLIDSECCEMCKPLR